MDRFIVIGISDDPEQFFPPVVHDIISSGRLFSGGRRHHALVAPLLPAGAQWIDIAVPLDAVFAEYARREGTIIVFASGDPLFSGFAGTLRRRLPAAEVTVYPSFNSLQMLAHRLLMTYDDLRVVALTGRPWPALDRALIERCPKIGVLTDRQHTPAAIARRLMDYGYGDYTMHVGEHLGNPVSESVVTLSPAAAAGRQFLQPNCLILEAPSALPPRPFGIADAAFSLLDGRERMITKMPLRLLTLQALELPRSRVFWDVGFCTGSVSIEARLQFPHLSIVAFEVRPECEALMTRNARRHGAPGIGVVMGDFLSPWDGNGPAASLTAAAPDAVFIGGHGGQLKAVMAKVARHLAPGGVIVMNSVTSAAVSRLTGQRPSSRQLFEEACSEQGLVMEPPLHIVLNDYNPIDILKCRK